MTADDKCSCHNRENLPLPIQMQLTKKQKRFSSRFISFLESTINFGHFEKKTLSLLHNLYSCY